MSDEDIGGWPNSNPRHSGWIRSAMILAGSILVVALPLCLFSLVNERTGTAGPWGVAAAAAVCLLAGITAEFFAALLCRTVNPLAALLVGMAFRLAPPLLVCLVLAVRGGGREHLAFVVYLMTLYLVTLTLDTWWAVQRIGAAEQAARRRSS